jgi:hypothetical protein
MRGVRRSRHSQQHSSGSGGSDIGDAVAAGRVTTAATSLAMEEDEMNNIGLDMGVGVQERRKLHDKRIRRGECPSCGVKCFEVNNTLFGKRTRVPLTIPGHVKDGVCLTCFPPPDAVAARPSPATRSGGSSEFLDVPSYINDDNQTVVSNITLDHRLWNFPGEEQFPAATGESRWKHESSSKSPKKTKPAAAAANSTSASHMAVQQPITGEIIPPIDIPQRPDSRYADMIDIDNRPQLPSRKPSDRGNLQASSGSFALVTGRSATLDDLKGLEMALVEDEDEDEDDEETLEDDERSVDDMEEEEDDDRSPNVSTYFPPPMVEAVEKSEHDERDILFDSKTRLLDFSQGGDHTNADEDEDTILVSSNLNSPTSQIRKVTTTHRDIAVDPRTLPIVDVPPLVLANPSTVEPTVKPAPIDVLVPRHSERQVTISTMYGDELGRLKGSVQLPVLPTEGGRPSSSSNRYAAAVGSRMPNREDPTIRPQMPRAGLESGQELYDVPRMPVRKESNRDVATRNFVGQKSFASSGTPSSTTMGTFMTEDVDISMLLKSLQDASDNPSRVAALEQLCGALTDVDAKEVFCRGRGTHTLNLTMWIDIADVEVQETCLDLILSLVAKASENERDFLVEEEGQNVIDVILIVMQRLLKCKGVQERGCRVLSCLARASAKNNAVSDGSTSGAVLTILHSMESHSTQKDVVEWGVRALYEFCVRSRHAESNKRILWSQPLENGKPGWSLLLSSIAVAPEDTVGLLWSLSSDLEGLEHLRPADEIVSQLLRILQLFQKDPQSSLLVEAALACISNFATVEANISQLDTTDICLIALSLVPMHLRSTTSLCSEACVAVSRLIHHSNKNSIVEQGGVNDLCLAMTDLHADEVLHEEALLALMSLIKDSSQAKQAVVSSTTFSAVMKLLRMYESSAKWQTTACQFFASLFAMDGILPSDIERDGLNAVSSAMTLHSHIEKVQEAGCVALGNLSGRPGGSELMADSDAVELALLAMNQFSRNLAIQIMTCVILWNKEYETCGEGEVDVVQCLVVAIQNHMESDRLLEVACGALLHAIYGSDEKKKIFAKFGGVEAIGCALVMHTSRPSVVEKLCEVMTCLSACPALTKCIVEADGVAYVLEAVRSHDSICIYRSVASFLKNIVVSDPRTCEEAVKGIAKIVTAMQIHRDDPDLQREACNYLWSMAALSEDGKSKILALDGISVVMETMEFHKDESDVHTAALGVFHELALAH